MNGFSQLSLGGGLAVDAALSPRHAGQAHINAAATGSNGFQIPTMDQETREWLIAAYGVGFEAKLFGSEAYATVMNVEARSPTYHRCSPLSPELLGAGCLVALARAFASLRPCCSTACSSARSLTPLALQACTKPSFAGRGKRRGRAGEKA